MNDSIHTTAFTDLKTSIVYRPDDLARMQQTLRQICDEATGQVTSKRHSEIAQAILSIYSRDLTNDELLIHTKLLVG